MHLRISDPNIPLRFISGAQYQKRSFHITCIRWYFLYRCHIKRHFSTIHKSSFSGWSQIIQDNDPKHRSKRAKEFMETNGINWFSTGPSGIFFRFIIIILYLTHISLTSCLWGSRQTEKTEIRLHRPRRLIMVSTVRPQNVQ